MAMEKENIRLEQICKAYGDLTVLSNVSFTVEQGKFVSIMGESGSGKSTLLGIMSANLRADSGKLYYGERDITTCTDKELAKLRCSVIGTVYQFFNLIPTLTAKENILLPVYLRRDSVRAAEQKIAELAETMNVADCIKKYPSELSGGQQQRVAIARSLIYNPKFLFLDEPTGNLDSKNSKAIMELLKRLNTDLGTTIIQVTHSSTAAEYSDVTVVIEDGRIKDEAVL